MHILYIAYSCSPYHGSEDKIGWKVPVEAAKHNQVTVITKEEQRPYIEEFLQEQPLKNIHFVYVDIPAVFKKIFRNGFYSGRLGVWNRRAFLVAKQICSKETVDVIHQIAPVEFRNIGNFGKIPGVKFVCGPIAGGQRTPAALRSYTCRHRIAETVREAVNVCSVLAYRLGRKLQRCDYLLLANQETWDYLDVEKVSSCPKKILTDVSIDRDDLAEPRGQKTGAVSCEFLVVGRLVYLKGHRFLLDVLETLPQEMDYTCTIVGDGPERVSLEYAVSQKHLEDKVKILGAVPYQRIADVYRQADVLVMPSLREATGSVLLEAMANGLPVVTINRFGGASILDENNGWLYDGYDLESCSAALRDALLDCINRPEEVARRGRNAAKTARQYTWEERMRQYQEIYNDLINNA